MSSTVNLPGGIIGQAYKQCITLKGKPKRLSMQSLPPGFTATLTGNVLCLQSDKLPSFGSFDWTVSVVSCRNCDVLQLVGEIAVAALDSCPCTEMTPLTQPIAPLTLIAGEIVDIVVPLTGSGPYEFCPGNQMPKCLTAKIIGESVFITGAIKESGRIAFSVKNSCGCECQEWSQKVDLQECIVPCATYWSISNRLFQAGIEGSETFSATGIPDCCALTLGAFIGDVPYSPDGIGQATIVLTAAAPTQTTTQLWGPAEVGLDFNWRPVDLLPCMTCPIMPRRIDFDVLPPPPCVTTWGLATTTFRAGIAKDQTYSATGIPKDCSLTLGAFIGNTPYSPTGVGQATITLTRDEPVAGPFPQMWPDADVGVDYNWQPISQPACQFCVVQPQRIDFDVSRGQGCDLTFSLTNPTITAAGQSHTIDVQGPVGTTVELRIVGTYKGIPVNVANPHTLPGPFPFTTDASVDGDVSSLTFTLVPVGASSAFVVCGGPFLTTSNVGAAPPVPGCPVSTSAVACGNTATRNASTTTSFALTQAFSDTTSVVATISPANPSLTISNGATSASVSGATPAAGTYEITFTGTKVGCTACVAKYLYTFSAVAPGGGTFAGCSTASQCGSNDFETGSAGKVNVGSWPIQFASGSGTGQARITSTDMSGTGPGLTQCKFTVPFSVLAGATTAGTFPSQITSVPIQYSAQYTMTISKAPCQTSGPSSCAFTTASGTSPSLTVSLNEPGRAGVDLNLSTGDYWVTLEWCAQLPYFNGLPGGYNNNVNLSFFGGV